MSGSMNAVAVEEQHEKLRRHVDEWEQRSARVVQVSRQSINNIHFKKKRC